MAKVTDLGEYRKKLMGEIQGTKLDYKVETLQDFGNYLGDGLGFLAMLTKEDLTVQFVAMQYWAKQLNRFLRDYEIRTGKMPWDLGS